MQDKSAQKRIRGLEGEDAATAYLKRERFTIIERNFRARRGEIDIIAKKGKTLYFIEVKARGDSSIIDPLEAVTKRKQQSIRRTAEHYLLKNPKMEKMPCSFGVIGIDHSYYPPRIECILDAFV
jgi:putative endonuclease